MAHRLVTSQRRLYDGAREDFRCGNASLDAVQTTLYRAALTGLSLGIPGGPANGPTQHQRTAARLADQHPSGSCEERLCRALAASAEEWARRSADDWNFAPDGRQW